jgi:hypothetical protein
MCSWTFADLEARVDQLNASETDLKNIIYRERVPERYLNMNISSCLMSASSTWSFKKPRIVTL